MKRLRILAVSFDTNIQPYQLPAFRGAIAAKVGLQHDWFHNHDNENGGTHNRYPLIQYKLDTHQGQMRPMLLCLDNAIEEAHHFFSQSDWTIDIRQDTHNLKIAKLNVHQYTLNTWQRPFTYRLHKWQAMNAENYQKYQILSARTPLERGQNGKAMKNQTSQKTCLNPKIHQLAGKRAKSGLFSRVFFACFTL